MAEPIQIGVRVVRGPHWEWKEVDGGEGHVGTIVAVEERMEGGWPVVVKWDCGSKCRCRCGVAGKYDLRVLDSAPTGVQHAAIECTWCGEMSIRGILWKCTQCKDYNLCTPCYNADKHCVDHKFNRLDTPSSRERVRVPPRYNCPRLIARGIFRGAEVQRGADWQWGDQDGGLHSVGKVIKIEGWEGQSGRSVAKVKWEGAQVVNVYRTSHKGKMDLRCIRAGVGGFYYPSHLPVLGAPKTLDHSLSAGDRAKVQLDPDLFKLAQQEHGGWDDSMAEYIGRVCVVHSMHRQGSCVVRYSDNRVLHLNVDTLRKVDTNLYTYGQTVRMIEDMAKVHQLQKPGAGWNDDMALCLGQVGRVVHVKPNSDVKVVIKGQRWILHPDTLVPAPGEAPAHYTADQIHQRIEVKIEVISLLDAKCVTDALALAVVAGDISTLKTHLEKTPDEINKKTEGKGLLHTAVVEGFHPVLELLLKYRPNVDLEDESGEMPLHVCAFSNNGPAAKLLLDAGANVNAVNGRGAAPLTIAAAQGHCEVMEVLLSSPHVDVNFQDSEGKTPMHRATHSHHRRALRLLLEAGADPTRVDLKLFTVAHEASVLGFLSAMEELVRFHPELLNFKKDNGSTPLHVAAANNHFSIVSLLASHPTCNVNAPNAGRLSALHIAVHEGHTQCVERLVGFGAGVNSIAEDGSTPLHLALGKKNMQTPTNDTPFILKIQEEIEETHGKGLLSPNIVVGIFLVMQGADLHIKNQLGVSPLKILPADIAALVSSYKGKSDSFHGALRELVRPFHNDLQKPIRGQQRIQTAPVTAIPAGSNSTQQRNVAQVHAAMDSHSVSLDAALASSASAQLNMNGGLSPIPTPKKTLCKTVSEADIQKCHLCENGADEKLQPCGHVNLCHDCVVCGKGVKKCPDRACRQPVSGHVPVCMFCKQDSSLERYSPCGHAVCTGCKTVQKHCLACQLTNS